MSMNVKNLRIGNWVLYNGYPFKIESGEELDKLIRGDGNPEQIPITQGILKDMGFEMKCWSALTNPYLELVCPDDEYRIKAHLNGHHGLIYEFYKNDCVRVSMIKQIEHVHDLQNALFNCGIEKEIVL